MFRRHGCCPWPTTPARSCREPTFAFQGHHTGSKSTISTKWQIHDRCSKMFPQCGYTGRQLFEMYDRGRSLLHTTESASPTEDFQKTRLVHLLLHQFTPRWKGPSDVRDQMEQVQTRQEVRYVAEEESGDNDASTWTVNQTA